MKYIAYKITDKGIKEVAFDTGYEFLDKAYGDHGEPYFATLTEAQASTINMLLERVSDLEKQVEKLSR